MTSPERLWDVQAASAARPFARPRPSEQQQLPPRSQQRILTKNDVAKALRDVAPGHLADLLDAQREQYARERPLLGRVDRREQVPDGDLAEALELEQLLLAQAT